MSDSCNHRRIILGALAGRNCGIPRPKECSSSCKEYDQIVIAICLYNAFCKPCSFPLTTKEFRGMCSFCMGIRTCTFTNHVQNAFKINIVFVVQRRAIPRLSRKHVFNFHNRRFHAVLQNINQATFAGYGAALPKRDSVPVWVVNQISQVQICMGV